MFVQQVAQRALVFDLLSKNVPDIPWHITFDKDVDHCS
jgi:hypothetical protein